MTAEFKKFPARNTVLRRNLSEGGKNGKIETKSLNRHLEGTTKRPKRKNLQSVEVKRRLKAALQAVGIA
jgi:hypothetical protein